MPEYGFSLTQIWVLLSHDKTRVWENSYSDKLYAKLPSHRTSGALWQIIPPWCSGYHYCTISFKKAWTLVPAGNKAKRLSLANHATKRIHHDDKNRSYCDYIMLVYFFHWCHDFILKIGLNASNSISISVAIFGQLWKCSDSKQHGDKKMDYEKNKHT